MIPHSAKEWIRKRFASGNMNASAALSLNPNTHETDLDYEFLKALQYAPSIKRFEDGITVSIRAHRTQSIRLFNNKEVGDIFVEIIFSSGNNISKVKFAIIQSKKLYSEETFLKDGDLEHIGEYAYMHRSPVFHIPRSFSFSNSSKYKQLIKNSPQMQTIRDFELQFNANVYYLLYNPLDIPHTISDIDEREESIESIISPKIGCRIIPFKNVDSGLNDDESVRIPSYEKMCQIGKGIKGDERSEGGWRVEDFIVDEILPCHHGTIYREIYHREMFRKIHTINRPFTSTISVLLQAPSGYNWDSELNRQ